ncbi:hypothetical protein MRX96_036435 [Rhipicephalus microplus]
MSVAAGRTMDAGTDHEGAEPQYGRSGQPSVATTIEEKRSSQKPRNVFILLASLHFLINPHRSNLSCNASRRVCGRPGEISVLGRASPPPCRRLATPQEQVGRWGALIGGPDLGDRSLHAARAATFLEK